MALAKTVCNVTEFPEHYEVVCIGDEKAVPAPEIPHKSSDSPTVAYQSEKTPSKPESKSSMSSRSSFTGQIAIQNQTATPFTTGSKAVQHAATSQASTMIIPKNTLPAETTQNTPAAATGSTIPQSAVAVVHRQGRQQYSKALQEAIAARMQLIAQQSQ
jgi:hypothetical protein